MEGNPLKGAQRFESADKDGGSAERLKTLPNVIDGKTQDYYNEVSFAVLQAVASEDQQESMVAGITEMKFFKDKYPPNEYDYNKSGINQFWVETVDKTVKELKDATDPYDPVDIAEIFNFLTSVAFGRSLTKLRYDESKGRIVFEGEHPFTQTL